MTKLINYLKDHFRSTANPLVLGWLALLLGLGMYWRYGMGNNPFFRQSAYQELWGLAFYTLPYLGTVLVIIWATKKQELLRQADFWLLSLLLIYVPFTNQFLLFYKDWLPSFEAPVQYFFRKLFFNLHTAFFYFLIPFLYWKFKDTSRKDFYGLTAKGFQAKPYLIMLVLMLPLLVWASFQPAFLKAYPRYQPGVAEVYWDVSSWVTVGVYEGSYAIQFVFLELFFRGFMVMALSRFLGNYAVYPMVAVYCFIHFAKPMPEALGSIFGGYILGVISLASRSVLGGVFIHLGVALGMEVLAFLQQM